MGCRSEKGGAEVTKPVVVWNCRASKKGVAQPDERVDLVAAADA